MNVCMITWKNFVQKTCSYNNIIIAEMLHEKFDGQLELEE